MRTALFSGAPLRTRAARCTLAKTGSGVETLSGTSTYSGGTNISGGILRLPSVISARSFCIHSPELWLDASAHGRPRHCDRRGQLRYVAESGNRRWQSYRYRYVKQRSARLKRWLFDGISQSVTSVHRVCEFEVVYHGDSWPESAKCANWHGGQQQSDEPGQQYDRPNQHG